MNFNDMKLTILSKEEIFGKLHGVGQLDVFKKYGTKAAITNLGVLTGNFIVENGNNIFYQS